VAGVVGIFFCGVQEFSLCGSLYRFLPPTEHRIEILSDIQEEGRESDQTTPSITIYRIDTSLATKRKETFDLETRFHNNKYVLTQSLFSAEDYGNLWITPDILILVELMGLFHCIWASSCVFVCLCVLEPGEIWWNAWWYCTVTVFRRAYPLPLSAHYARGCFIYVPEKEGRILASVRFIWKVYDGTEIHTDDNFLPTDTQNVKLEAITIRQKKFGLNSNDFANQKCLFSGKYTAFVHKRIWDTP
jgi:hypothetical protein